MKFSYIKLNAQKKLVKNHFKSLVISALPYVIILLLTILNYYLYIFLKDINFDFIPFISSYDVYVKASLLTLSIVLSFVLWKMSQLYCDKYFYSQNMNVHIKLSLRQYITAISVSLLRFYLSVAWGAFAYAPCVIMGFTLYYSINSRQYTFNVMLTLFVATILLLVIGSAFLYIILKRYSLCNYVIISNSETDAIKVIEKSINITDSNIVKYALYCVSFIGWILSCILILPVFYVLPYIKMAKYSFYKAIANPATNKAEQKPVIFYLNKKIKVVGD